MSQSPAPYTLTGILAAPGARDLDLAADVDLHARPVVIDDATALGLWLKSVSDFQSENTVRSYHKEAVRFRIWAESVCDEHPALLAKLNATHANSYINFLANPLPFSQSLLRKYGRSTQPFKGALSPASIKQSIVILSAMYQRLRDIESHDGQPYVRFNPFALIRSSVKSNREQSNTRELLKRYIPLDDWGTVSRLLHQLHGENANLAGKRAVWIVHLLYYSWSRREEAASLRMDDFFLAKNGWRLCIRGKGGGTESVIVTEAFLDALKTYREANGLPALPLPGENLPAVLPLRWNRSERPGNVHPQTLYRVIKETFAAIAELVSDANPQLAERLRKAAPHWLRHSGVSHAADLDVDVKPLSRQARHKNITTTMNVYYHEDDALARAQFENVQAKLKNKDT